jgi:hypothetical protein
VTEPLLLALSEEERDFDADYVRAGMSANDSVTSSRYKHLAVAKV